MKPTMLEFTDETALLTKVQQLTSDGVLRDDLYVLSHDDSVHHVSENTNTNQIGIQEEGLVNAVGTVFREEGEKLREKLNKFGYTSTEAEKLKRKLDDGKILLFVQDE